MNYTKTRFSVGMGGASFGGNWEKTFGGKTDENAIVECDKPRPCQANAEAEKEIAASPSEIVKAVSEYLENCDGVISTEIRAKLQDLLAGKL